MTMFSKRRKKSSQTSPRSHLSAITTNLNNGSYNYKKKKSDAFTTLLHLFSLANTRRKMHQETGRKNERKKANGCVVY